MRDYRQFYINGRWVNPSSARDCDVINPANEEVCGVITLGNETDVDAAVLAAKDAFGSFGHSSRQERVELLESCVAVYQKRYDEIAIAIREEMGSPQTFALEEQADCGLGHLQEALRVLRTFKFEEDLDHTRIYKEPVGVCGLITPWNWPLNQIACKVAPALAVGCTMVLKPSEIAPFSAYIWSEIMHEAGVPAGVYNMVNGDGPGVGTALSGHPDVDMVSFTGSTRAGVLVAQNAAPSVKRVAQELGGKSANIILDDADLDTAVTEGVLSLLENTGQSCNAPSRMLVPAAKMEEAESIALRTAQAVVVGDPANALTTMGPVLTMIPYETEEEAIAVANDTVYGLAGYVQSCDIEHARAVAARIRAGNVKINGASGGYGVPFGGYKQSGNGRECGEHGFTDFIEIKAVEGYRE